jgi:hypothetical protein
VAEVFFARFDGIIVWTANVGSKVDIQRGETLAQAGTDLIADGFILHTADFGLGYTFVRQSRLLLILDKEWGCCRTIWI